VVIPCFDVGCIAKDQYIFTFLFADVQDRSFANRIGKIVIEVNTVPIFAAILTDGDYVFP
jgi:hypothetical protein